MLVSQLEYYFGREWLDKPFGRYVQEHLQHSRFADARELPVVVESQTSVRLIPFGWAVVRSRPAGLYEHSVLTLDVLDDLPSDMVHRGRNMDRIERIRPLFIDTLMTEWWDKSGMLDAATSLLEQLQDLYPKLISNDIAGKRIAFIGKALQYHRAEGYEASVLIVLAQIDGLVRDAMNVDIFDKRCRVSDLMERAHLSPAAIHSFQGIRVILSKSVPTTQSRGVLSRHGVLHGRELGYDTKVNSVKAFVALIAILEWLQAAAQVDLR